MHYNEFHACAGSVVEHAIGLLKWRCRALDASGDRLLYHPAKVYKIIWACGVLHNVALRLPSPTALWPQATAPCSTRGISTRCKNLWGCHAPDHHLILNSATVHSVPLIQVDSSSNTLPLVLFFLNQWSRRCVHQILLFSRPPPSSQVCQSSYVSLFFSPLWPWFTITKEQFQTRLINIQISIHEVL